jgi:WD40 repeat protein
LRGHTREILAAAVARHSPTVFTESADKTIKQWQPLQATDSETFPASATSLHFLGLSADSRTVAALSDGTLLFLEMPGGKQGAHLRHTAIRGVPDLPQNPGMYLGMAAVSPDLKWMATVRLKAPLEIQNIEANARYVVGDALNSGVYAAFSPDSRLVAFLRARNVVLLNVAERREEATIPVPRPSGDWITPFMFAADAKSLVIGREREVLIWDTQHQLLSGKVPIGHKPLAIGFAPSADGRRLAIAYADDSFTLHDCQTGRQEGNPIPAHLSGVQLLCFSPDGRTLATTSQRWLKLWNLATRGEVATFDVPSMVIAMAFTADGNSLVAQSRTQLHIWRAPSTQEIKSELRVRADAR